MVLKSPILHFIAKNIEWDIPLQVCWPTMQAIFVHSMVCRNHYAVSVFQPSRKQIGYEHTQMCIRDSVQPVVLSVQKVV